MDLKFKEVHYPNTEKSFSGVSLAKIIEGSEGFQWVVRSGDKVVGRFLTGVWDLVSVSEEVLA